MNAITQTRPAEFTCADAGELEARMQLAACYRMFARRGMDDLIYTHLSARIPGREGRFLFIPFGMLFEEVTASNLHGGGPCRCGRGQHRAGGEPGRVGGAPGGVRVGAERTVGDAPAHGLRHGGVLAGGRAAAHQPVCRHLQRENRLPRL